MAVITEQLILDADDALQGVRSYATEARKAADEQRRLNATLSDQGAAGSAAARGTNQAGAAMVNLGQQAQDVFVQLSMGTNPLMVLAQQGPQIASAVQQAGGLGATLAAMAPVVTALAPVFAGLVVSFGLMAPPLALANHQLEQMEAKADRAAAAAARLAESRRSWADQRDSIALDVRVASGELDEAEAAFIRAAEVYRRARSSTRDVLAQTVKEAEAADPMARTSAPAQATTKARRELEAYNEATERGATLAGMLAEKRIREAEGTDKSGVAHKAAAQAIREEDGALRSLLRSFEEEERIARRLAEANLALSFSRGEITNDAYQRGLSGLAGDAFQSIGQQATDAEASRQAGAGDLFRDLTAALVAQTFATGENTEATRQSVAAEAASRLASGVSMAAGGPSAVMGAVSSAGPWGAIIAALVELVRDFGNIGNMFNDFTKSVQDGIRNFPATVAENLSTWLQTAVESVSMLPDFLESLADSLPEILTAVLASIPELIGALIEAAVIKLPVALIKAFAAFFSREMWAEIGKAIAQAFVDAWKSIIDTGKDTFGSGGSVDRTFVGPEERAAGEKSTFFNQGGFFDALWGGTNENWWGLVGSYDDGGYIPRTGLAMVHEGEYVETKGKSRARSRGRSGTTIQAGFIFGGRAGLRELQRYIDEEMTASGAGWAT